MTHTLITGAPGQMAVSIFCWYVFQVLSDSVNSFFKKFQVLDSIE